MTPLTDNLRFYMLLCVVQMLLCCNAYNDLTITCVKHYSLLAIKELEKILPCFFKLTQILLYIFQKKIYL